MSDQSQNKSGIIKTVLICGTIILIGAMITVIIYSTEPVAKRERATKKTAMLVDVVPVEKGDFTPTIRSLGTVMAAQEIVLKPRVRGEVVEMAEEFVPGGFVNKGETLLRLDPEDYENQLLQAESELQSATSDYNIEMGLQNVAEKEFDMFGDPLDDESKKLVLREPQLAAAKARVAAARATFEQAKLELERTHITAPFDAQIIERMVNIGSQVQAGNDLAMLAGTGQYWIEATVPMTKLQWLNFSGSADDPAARAVVRNRTAWPEGERREGYLFKLIGRLEGETRLARVLIAVDDPLALGNENKGRPKLMLGSYVEIGLKGKELKDVVRIDRKYVRNNGAVWVKKDGKLSIREVEIAFRDDEYAYITKGLTAGEMVVITNLSTVVDGAALRTAGEDKQMSENSDK